MSTGPMASFADIIGPEDIKQIVPNAQEMMRSLERRFASRVIGEVFSDELLADCLDVDRKSDAILWRDYRKFQEDFREAVSQFHDEPEGLCPIPELHLGYHSEDVGGCHDEITGLYWYLTKTRMKTPYCLEIENVVEHDIQRVFWTVQG